MQTLHQNADLETRVPDVTLQHLPMGAIRFRRFHSGSVEGPFSSEHISSASAGHTYPVFEYASIQTRPPAQKEDSEHQYEFADTATESVVGAVTPHSQSAAPEIKLC